MKPTKKQFLSEVSKHKGSKKYFLSIMTDLKDLVAEMKSFDLESKFSTTMTEYDNAIRLMDEARNAADRYVPLASDFEADAYEQWEVYQKAQEKYFEITNQLQDLGIDESPELTDLFSEIANGEEVGRKALDQQDDFSDHNELVDISNYN